jgi:TatD DNase family protein
MTPLFDTHCHLQDPGFKGEGQSAVERALSAGVGGLLLCGYDEETNREALAMGDWARGVYPGVGYHPHEAAAVTPSMLDELEHQAGLPEVVCVGEIGLDFFRDRSPRDVQRDVIDAQLAIALRTGKPVSVHSRGAEDHIYEHLAAYASKVLAGKAPGVMHCFGGTLEQATRYVDLGFVISFPCTITYPKNDEARRMAAALPLEAIVIETDSPYLPPQHMRGQRNEPAYISAAVEGVARARGISLEDAAAATTANAERVFRVPVVKSVPAGAA